MKKFDILEHSKSQVREYFASENRVAGATSYKYNDGMSEGTRAIHVKTGNGFHFEVLPDRGMDICKVEYCGIPISWEGKCGVIHPAFYDAEESAVMRTFLGGLLTTCGLTNAGSACEDREILFSERLGMHGRINYIAAEDLCISQDWDAEEYKISISGKMRETRLYCENLRLTREIKCQMGENRLFIHDKVENLGFQDSPLMLLYHINFGYPVVSPQTVLYTGYAKNEPLNEFAKEKRGDLNKFSDPRPEYKPDNIRFYAPKYQEMNYAVLFNESLDFGAYIRFKNNQLPYMTEWIQMAKQEYVVGFEPGNCLPEGRVAARNNQRLVMLKPGEIVEFDLEIGILEDGERLSSFISQNK